MRDNYRCEDYIPGISWRWTVLYCVFIAALLAVVGLVVHRAEAADPLPLGANVNLSPDVLAPAHAAKGWRTRLTTDVVGDVAHPGAWRATVSALLSFGARGVGTYYQIAHAGDAADQRYPARGALLGAVTLPSPVMDVNGRSYWDHTRPEVRAAWADAAARDVAQRGASIVYLDGAFLGWTWGAAPKSAITERSVSWADQLDAARLLHERLSPAPHPITMDVWLNVAGGIGGWTAEELRALSQSVVAGITLEQPMRWREGDMPLMSLVQTRELLAAGKQIVYIPVTTLPAGVSAADAETLRSTEERFIAAWSLLVRRTETDPLYVSPRWFKAAPEWESWPQRLGPPIGEYRLAFTMLGTPGGPRVIRAWYRRDFERGTVLVDPHAKRGDPHIQTGEAIVTIRP